ncbi:hypothetical protein [Sorangium sp. So ce1099]|uniref:hypothetical protein n=1 Tax=Sorangium sp. So ce1099 TaxID=3133331 RepID=UPI003F5EA739
MRKVIRLVYRQNSSGAELFNVTVKVVCEQRESSQIAVSYIPSSGKVLIEQTVFVLDGDEDVEVQFIVNFVFYDARTNQPPFPNGLSGSTRRSLRDIQADSLTVTVEYDIKLVFDLTLLDCSGIALAPALVPEEPDPSGEPVDEGETDMALDAPSGSSSTDNRNGINVSERYLCQPGTYSGDAWHVAAALLYDPELRLVVPRPPILAWALRVDAIAIGAAGVDAWEVQLRSSLGMTKTVTQQSQLPQVFYFAGNLELWMTAWQVVLDHESRRSGEFVRRGHVIEFFHAASAGALQPGPPRTFSFDLQPDHTMTLAGYLEFEDEGLPLPQPKPKPLAIKITVATQRIAQDIQEVRGQLSPGEFAFDNLVSILRNSARALVSDLIEALNGGPLYATRSESEQRRGKPEVLSKQGCEALADDALLFVNHIPWRLLSQNLERSIQRRLFSAVRDALHRYFPRPEILAARIESLTGASDAFVQTANKIAAKLRTVLEKKNKPVQKTKHITKSNQFLDFYVDCELPDIDDRMFVRFFEYNPRQGPQLFSMGREMVKEIAEGAPLCGMTFSATSVLMRAVEMYGIDRVRADLRDHFTRGLSYRKRQEIERKVDALRGGGKCLLLNMRLGGYHPEHDVTEGIYRQLQRLARRHGWTLVCAGKPPAEWIRLPGVTVKTLDVYSDADLGSGMPTEVDMRQTAYLWSLVADCGEVVGIVGGMSGSLDIAAYMGVKTFCWDISLADRRGIKLKQSAEYPDSVRLLLSYPFMSIGPRRIDGLIKDSALVSDKTESALLDEAALELWLLDYNVIPRVARARFDPTRVLSVNEAQKRAFAAVLLNDLQAIPDNILKAEGV